MAGDEQTIAVAVLRVFCDELGDHGNPLGVVLDGSALPVPADRQEFAFELGFSETVFVDSPEGDEVPVRTFTPAVELPLAGHPLVGTAWLLGQAQRPAAALLPPAGRVAVAATEHHAEIVADPSAAPTWQLDQRAAPDDVDGLDAAEFGPDAHTYAWAWVDEHAGIIRARGFASGKGIAEDEATGSAALVLCRAVGRAVRIRQGRGSVIDAAPEPGGLVRVRGRVVRDEVLEIPR